MTKFARCCRCSLPLELHLKDSTRDDAVNRMAGACLCKTCGPGWAASVGATIREASDPWWHPPRRRS